MATNDLVRRNDGWQPNELTAREVSVRRNELAQAIVNVDVNAQYAIHAIGQLHEVGAFSMDVSDELVERARKGARGDPAKQLANAEELETVLRHINKVIDRFGNGL